MERDYNEPIDESNIGDLMTVAEWNEAVKEGMFKDYDGVGYWCRNGFESSSNVFDSPQLDATHVNWFNK